MFCFSCDLQDFIFQCVNRKALGVSFLYWVDFIRYLTYCRQANVGFCTGFFPFGKFLRGNSLIWNEFQPKYTFFFTKFQFTANISAHFAHQVNFPRFDHIYNFGGPVNKNKWLRYLTGSVMTNWFFFRISTDR